MRIGIYTDPHVCINSSILPMYSEIVETLPKWESYTTRLKMIINSYRWMYELFNEHQVDLIVNCGDTFDSHMLKAEEISAISECYGLSKGVHEYHIVGNHEMINSKFYSNHMLGNIDFIEVIDEPMKIGNMSFLPYRKPEDITYELLESLKSDILFSHIDIKGSTIRTGYDLEYGIDPEYLAMNFVNTFNGHIHRGGMVNTSVNTVRNIGSMTGLSFADSNSYLPRVLIYDTDQDFAETFNNPQTIVFRKITASSIDEFMNKLGSLNKNYMYALRVTVPYSKRDEISEILRTTDYKIVASRINVDIRKSQESYGKDTKLVSNYEDMDMEFLKFLENNQELLKYPYDKYVNLIGRINNVS